MKRPLSPDEIFPARSTDISQRFVTLASGVRIRIAEAGSLTGDPVLMLPGWGGSLYMFRHGLGELPRHGFRAIAADLRGFGLSDRPRRRGAYTLDAYLGDVNELLDALGLERAAIVAQSMGGGIALHFALRHPQRVTRLVPINPTGLIPLRFLPVVRLAPRALVGAGGRRIAPRAMIRFILRYLAYGDPRLVTERDIDEYWAPTQLSGYVYAARSALSEFDWRRLTDAQANALATPTLVLLGKSDRLVRNRESDARRLAGARVRMLEGGHCAHEEHPAEAYGVIARFLRRQERDGD